MSRRWPPATRSPAGPTRTSRCCAATPATGCPASPAPPGPATCRSPWPTRTGSPSSASGGGWARPCPASSPPSPGSSLLGMADLDLNPASRVDDVAARVRAEGLDALLLTPGADLRYVTGYEAKQLERLTCLVIPAGDPAFLVVPRLELAAAQASPASGLGLELIPWEETEDPYALIADRLGPVATTGLADQMWALMVLKLRAALPGARQVLASAALRDLRMRKSPAEVTALREAGAAIDRVHRRVPGWLRAGRTEREVGADIAEAILAEGHVQVDFVIVGSGPNGASPHHEVSDRVLQPGDPVVVDIGGPGAARDRSGWHP